MNTYILLAVFLYPNKATAISQPFDSKQTCVAAATSLRNEIDFTKGGVIKALQCVRK